MERRLKYRIVIGVIHSLILFVLPGKAQSDSHIYKDSLVGCKYQTTLGMLNGTYVSYYKNGIKKSEGNFQYNNRIGEWSVWDSTGKLRVKRNYSDPYEYIQTYPGTSSEGPIPLLNKPVYKLERDSLGEWKYFRMEERMVTYSQRNFKCFYTSDKQLFFNCETLNNILCENAFKNNYHVYATEKGNEDITYKTRIDVSTIDTSKVTLVGFRMKSDFVFDNSRLMSQDIPLFITVLVTDKINPKDTFDLFNVYYPNVRKYFAQVKVTTTGRPSYLQNLDDVFFFECFKVEKWETRKGFDRGFNKYILTPSGAVNKYLLEEIETENNLWLYYNSDK